MPETPPAMAGFFGLVGDVVEGLEEGHETLCHYLLCFYVLLYGSRVSLPERIL